jgi:hypothetical protein
MAQLQVDIARTEKALAQLKQELEKQLQALRELGVLPPLLQPESEVAKQAIRSMRAEIEAKQRTVAALGQLLDGEQRRLGRLKVALRHGQAGPG